MNRPNKYFLVALSLFGLLSASIGIPWLVFSDGALPWQLAATGMAIIGVTHFALRRHERLVDEILSFLTTYNPELQYRERPLREKLTMIREEYRRTLEKKQATIANYTVVKRELERVNTINTHVLSISQHLFDLSSEKELFDYILSSLVAIIPGAEKGSFLKRDGANDTMRFVSTIGYPLKDLAPLRIELRDTFLFVATEGTMDRPVVIEDMKAFDREHIPADQYEHLDKAMALNLTSCLSAPIFRDDELYAMINLDSLAREAFTEQDLQVVNHFTTQMTMALKNYELIHKIKYLSKYDKLTDVMNRSYFEDFLQAFTEERAKTLSPFALALMDLDGLKTINDTYGHAAGDLAIVRFVDEVKTILGPKDFMARIGGDEFIAIFDEARQAQASATMETLNEKMQTITIEHHGRRIPVRFSYGLSYAPDESMVYEILFKIADDRMYKHKLAKND